MNKTLAYILAVSCILIAYIFACCTFAFVKIEKNQRNLLEKSGNGPKLLFFPSAERVVPYDTIFFRCKKWHGVTARSVLYHFLWQAQYPSFFHGFERVVPHIVWQAQLKDLLMAGAKLVACCPFAKWQAQVHGETHVLIER